MDLELLKSQALSMLNIPYKWGGKTPMGGLDCSGLVSILLKSAGLIKPNEELNAQGLYDKFIDLHTSSPRLGSLCFYGNGISSVKHVVFCLDDHTAVGADNGGSTVDTLAEAIANQAFVKLLPINYRTDIVGIIFPF